MDGYGSSRWGMSVEELLASDTRIFRLLTPIDFNSWDGRAQLKGLPIGQAQYDVTYLFERIGHRLAQVNINPVDASPSMRD